MSTFLQAMDLFVLMSIQQGWKRLTTPESEWEETQMKAHTANYKPLNAIFCAVNQNKFKRICSLTSAKETWELSKVTHEGTNVVKKSKFQMLTTKFKELKMEEDEKFINFYTRLQDLVNSKAGLRDPLKSEAIVRKILRLLLERFKSKVTAIEDIKDINTLIVEELVGSLRTSKMTLKTSAKRRE